MLPPAVIAGGTTQRSINMIMQPIPVTPVMPVRPWVTLLTENIPLNVTVNALAAVLFVGVALLLGWKFTEVLQKRNFKSNLVINLILSGTAALALFLRFGMTVTILQGLFLFFILLFATWSDLTSHEVPDWVWLCLIPVAIMSIPSRGVLSIFSALLVVIVPQLAVRAIRANEPIGGADTKLTFCAAILLGFMRGVGAYLVGLLVAVIFMSICNKVKNRSQKAPFALIPFLSGAVFTAFLI